MKIEEPKESPFRTAAQLLLLVESFERRGWKTASGMVALAVLESIQQLALCLLSAAMSAKKVDKDDAEETAFRDAMVKAMDAVPFYDRGPILDKALADINAMMAAKAS